MRLIMAEKRKRTKSIAILLAVLVALVIAARLLRGQAPVVPVVTLRRGRRHYEIVLGEPRWVDRNVAGDTERALRQTVEFFERTIRENPEQWFRFSPFWLPR